MSGIALKLATNAARAKGEMLPNSGWIKRSGDASSQLRT
jgi:hypothetical protein